MDKALLVGINTYPGSPLRGCVNDVTDMADFIVKSCKFEADNARLLTDGNATRDAIVERLGWLLSGAESGDRLFFHYSGHGAQMAGRSPQGQVDRVHDVICPVDFDWSDEHAIKDTDFQGLFDEVPTGVIFDWISDSCHSGHLIKDMASTTVKMTPKALIPPADMAWKIQVAVQKRVPCLTMSKAPGKANVALISGCKSDQTSADAEFEGTPNGALTYYLLQELRSAAGLKESLGSVVRNLRRAIANAKYTQTPQLEGSPKLAKDGFLSGKIGKGLRH